MAASMVPGPQAEPRVVNRWLQMIAGIVAMMAIANLQYAWTLFTTPLTKTCMQPWRPSRWHLPRLFCAKPGWCHSKVISSTGLDLVWSSASAASWSASDGLAPGMRYHSDQLYIFYALGGIGAGAVYGGCMGNSLKWFPDHRGLCARLYRRRIWHGNRADRGADSQDDESLRIPAYFCHLGHHSGHHRNRCRACSSSPRRKDGNLPNWTAEPSKVRTSTYDMTYWRDDEAAIVLRDLHHDDDGSFRRLGGHCANQPHRHLLPRRQGDCSLGHVGAGAGDRTGPHPERPLPAILGMDVSDHIGRENTMFIAFLSQALAVWACSQLISHPLWFIIDDGLAVSLPGARFFRLFPSITGDLFGKKWATTNYGIVYTAKGTASIFAGPVAAMASVKDGLVDDDVLGHDWLRHSRALLALLWLKPVAITTIERAMKMQEQAGAKAMAKAAGAGS